MIDGRRGRKEGDSEAEEAGDVLDEGVEPDGDAIEAEPALEMVGAVIPGNAPEDGVAASEDGVAGPATSEHPEPKRDRAFVRMLKSLGPWLVSKGVSADHVTVVGLVVSAATGVMIGLGSFYVAIGLLTFGGLMDTLDGAVAKAAGTSSKRGAFFDSVSDRVADMFVFGGLTWYFAAGPGHDPKLALLPIALLGVSNTISYERAKAESLGYEAKGGLMERAERLIIVGIALLWHVTLVPVLCVLLVLCVITAVQRFFKVWGQASAERTPGLATAGMSAAGGVFAARAKRPPRVESRWRVWREARAAQERKPKRVPVVSRTRSRRRPEPLTTRVRRAFTTERAGARATTRTGHSFGTRGSGRVRSERRRQGAAAAFRRRLGSGR